MWLQEADFIVKIGGATFANVATILMFGKIPIFRLYRQDDGYLGIDFEIYGSEGERIATIRRNNVYWGDRERFSIEGGPDETVLYAKTPNSRIKTPILDIRKRAASAPAELEIVSLITALPDKRILRAGLDYFDLPGLSLQHVTIQNWDTGVFIPPLPWWTPSVDNADS
jgi:hypothetical protein